MPLQITSVRLEVCARCCCCAELNHVDPCPHALLIFLYFLLQSFFSTAGNVQSEDRTSMSTETLKYLAILKANPHYLPNKFCRSWVKLRECLQNKSLLGEEVIVVESMDDADIIE